MQRTGGDEFANIDNTVAPKQQRLFIARQVRAVQLTFTSVFGWSLTGKLPFGIGMRKLPPEENAMRWWNPLWELSKSRNRVHIWREEGYQVRLTPP